MRAYHAGWVVLGVLLYRHPTRSLTVIGVTGTKGKTSTTEYINAVFEAAGFTTAVSNSIRVKFGETSIRNQHRMSMPGRLAMQRFFARAKSAGATVAIIEMTSEGAALYRHRGIALDTLVFTNLSPEHIESHGSFEKYKAAKLEIGAQLVRSPKRPRTIVAHQDDPVAKEFLALPVEAALPYTLRARTPYEATDSGGFFTYQDTAMHVHLPGIFSLQNALAAATVATAHGIEVTAIQKGIDTVHVIPGRAETIDEGQPFTVVVDYAHNPSSLEAIYTAYGTRRKICILGSTGGGRDQWKRPEMGTIADTHCDHIILTNEDPYDEDPQSIVAMIAKGITTHTPEVILDRHAAIAHACTIAKDGDVVLITGKGTDPSIQGKAGSREAWSDAAVTREVLKKHPWEQA